MNKSKYHLYIEGTSDGTNGDLRTGFHDLLIQELAGKMPRIRMTNGKSQTISSFKHPILSQNPLLVIDLDASVGSKEDTLKSEGLYDDKERVFFMVQEMEAWFLSQPKILDKFYNSNISSKIIRNPSDIPNPSDELVKLTKNIHKRHPYHKVKHGVELLGMLDLKKLKDEFDDVKRLIEKLKE